MSLEMKDLKNWSKNITIYLNILGSFWKKGKGSSFNIINIECI